MPKNKPVVLDSNAVIHFILAYDMTKFKIVAQALTDTQCYVPIEVIAETVYVLNGKFQLDRQTVTAKLRDFIVIQDNLVSEINAIAFGLSIYASFKFDIVDSLIAGYAKVNGNPVLTFDSNLQKELAEQVYIP